MGWARENGILVARFGYRLKSGGWKVDAPIHPPGGGVLQRAGVLALNAMRDWGPRNDDSLDNAWLCMHNHASRETRAGAEGREEEGEGDDDARSRSSAGICDPRGRSRGPRGPGRPRKVP